MNKTIEKFARAETLRRIAALPEACHRNFRLCFGRKGGKRSVDDALLLSLPDVVAEIPADDLDGALNLIERTEASNAKREAKG